MDGDRAGADCGSSTMVILRETYSQSRLHDEWVSVYREGREHFRALYPALRAVQ